MINKNMKNKKWNIAINAFITLIIFGLLLFLQKIIPFGENSFLTTDLNSQYVNFFSYLKLILQGDKSIFYSFSKAIGGGLESLYSYYLLSPFNLIFLFFKLKDIELAITVLFTLKLLAISTTSYIYFCKISKYGYNLSNMAFSLAFTFCAYNIVYMQNIMWLDVVIALPLVLLGIEKIISDKDNKLFVLALSYSIITNFYLSFMVCIFSCLYLAYKLVSQNSNLKNMKEKSIIFCFSGLLSAGISAVIILPTIFALGKSFKSIDIGSIFSWEIITSAKDFVMQMFLPKPFQWRFLVDGAPNLFCGIIAPILFILFFTCKNISKKAKITAGLVSLIIFVGLFFKGQSLLWHGGSQPIWFIHRNAVFFTFWIIFLAFSLLQTVDTKQYKVFIVFFIAVNTLSLFIYDLDVFKNIKYSPNNIKEHIENYSPVFEYINDADETDFYRTGFTKSRTLNDPMLLGYNSISHYSTGDSEITKQFADKAGYNTSKQWICYSRGSSLPVDSLMGIKYIVSPYISSANIEKITDFKDVAIYKNGFAFPLGFVVNNKLNTVDINALSPDAFTNAVYSGISGHDVKVDIVLEDVQEYTNNMENINVNGYRKLSPQDSNAYINHTFVAPASSDYYMRVDMKNLPNGEVQVPTSGINFPYFYLENKETIFIGSFDEGEIVEVTSKIYNTLEFKEFNFFYTDIETLKYVSEKAQKLSFEITNFKDNKISGNITVKESDCNVFFTIPYDKGWKIYVDERKIIPQLSLDTFISIPLEKGTYNIKLIYYPEYLFCGIIISLLSILIFILQQLLIRKNNRDKNTR